MVTLIPPFKLTGFSGTKEPDLWVDAYVYSFLGHGAFLLLLFLLTTLQKSGVEPLVLQEINFLDASVPIVSPKEPDAIEPGGGDEGENLPQTPARTIHAETNVKMKNKVPFSSPGGSPKGIVASPLPMTGPIVPVESLGVVGRKKGALLSLSGRTEGPRNPAMMILPVGIASSSPGGGISLNKEDISAIQRKEGVMGIPLISKQVVGNALGGKIRGLASPELGSKRKNAYESLKANPLEKNNWGQKKGPFSIEGPLKYRRIVRMELPPYPRWAEEKGIESSVSFRLWVDPQGRVKENMYLEKASGYGELDSLAKDALKRFIFVALPDDAAQEDEWGVATFRFELKR